VARELARYKSDLLGVRKVRWDEGGTETAEDYTKKKKKGHENHQLRTEILVDQRIESIVKTVEFLMKVCHIQC
jgi:hypothetical protein